MGAHWVRNDPLRREEFLALVRANPRITVLDLAQRMRLTPPTIHKFVLMFEREGTVFSECDPAAKRTPRSAAPRVVWIAGARRVSREAKIPRSFACQWRVSRVPSYSYSPTGTLASRAGAIQILAIGGRR